MNIKQIQNITTSKAAISSSLLTMALLTCPTSYAADADLEQRVAELEQKLEMTADQLESSSGHGDSLLNGVSVGGYGELHYNNLDNNKVGGSDKKEMDFHRFVLFIGKEFTDKIRFFSELELEHSLAGEGKNGEVELEQAYIDFDINDNHTARGGLFLVPVGILNETHEPTTFYGVERNPIEKNIIPATWWEGGAALHGEFAPGWGYDVAVTSGLNNSGYNIRSGRQKVSEANANDLAYTGRIKWTGIPGLELAATAQLQDNITQGVDPDASATLIETHAVWQSGPFGVRALYATWDIDGAGAKAVGMNEQTGWYVEPSFKVNPSLGLFARVNQWDNAAGDTTDSEYKQLDVGLNYWPNENVVVKVDIQTQDSPTGQNEYDGTNIGIGYQF